MIALPKCQGGQEPKKISVVSRPPEIVSACPRVALSVGCIMTYKYLPPFAVLRAKYWLLPREHSGHGGILA